MPAQIETVNGVSQAGTVVGLGASVGGLQALAGFFSRVPPDSGMSFIVVQHLGRHRPSMLPELLRRHARIPVEQAQDGALLVPDHVYVIPPDARLTLEHGCLRVSAADEPGQRMPVDAFFRSLAEDRGERAVGIVLSGSGTDGTSGLRAIKEHGGLTLAQSPGTAQNDAMPQSAIAAGLVDYVLPVEQMATRVLAHSGQRSSATHTPVLDAPSDIDLPAICSILHRATGHDFSRYKAGTLVRRIHRRMHLRRAASPADYKRLLEEDAEEPQLLLKDLLIGVTRFFRDPEAFEALALQVLPRLLEGKPADAPLRIWVPGCASGEEAYSIAILVREHLARLGSPRLVQLFATDIDPELLAAARAGRYGAEIAEHVTPEHLRRFFTYDDGGYQVAKELREMCIISAHNLTRDPPFSSLDLISCRNVLIYFDAGLQKKLVPIFHWALRPGGFLILGPSEGLTGSRRLFTTFDKRHRIFRRLETVRRPGVDSSMGARGTLPSAPVTPTPPAPETRRTDTRSFERLLVDEYAPCSALISERGEIVVVAGKTAPYLQIPAGAPSTNILDHTQGYLRIELRAALSIAVQSRRKVARSGVPVDVDGSLHRVRLTVQPLPGDTGLLAVVVQQMGAVGPLEDGDEAPTAISRESAFERIERELQTTRADLKRAVEDLESANEELKSSNEELISTNEELQSANEELQTSKEEMQSVNEELETVNAELQQNVLELGAANSDLANLFASTEVATIFLDRALRIARFTPAATRLFSLIESDVGRPLGDLAPRFEGQDLLADAREVLRALRPLERQVRSPDGKSWFILRALPYRTIQDVVGGVVITFVDVSELKRAEAALRQGREDLDRAQEVGQIGSWRLDVHRDVLTWSDENHRIFGVPKGTPLTYEMFLGIVHPDDRQHVDTQWQAGLRGEPYDVEHRIVVDGQVKWVREKAYLEFDDDGSLLGGFGISQDITERKRAEEGLKRSRQGLGQLAEASLRVMRETDFDPMFRAISAAAIELTGARVAVSGHGYVSGQFVIGGAARAPGTPDCPPGKEFVFEKGGVYMDLVEGAADSIRLTDEQLRAHSRWWGLPEGHVPMRGLLAARLVDRQGRTNGMILVTDKEQGEFTAEDESHLRHLGTLASLASQHVEARMSLEEADRSKNQFLAMLSHELRNPLAPIRHGLFILDRAEPGSDHARRALTVIERQVGHMTHIVDDLLDVTRISRGKLHLRRESTDFADVVRRAVDDHRAMFATGSLDLRVSIPDEPIRINGDRTRVAQVIGNLLQNAARFTQPGGTVIVTVESNEPLQQAVACVRDTGPGVAPDMLSRIFEPFTQADTSLDRSKGGLGLGLSLVKGIMEMHGGTASAESEGLGRGTAFTVRFPLESALPSATESMRDATRGTARRRVLVIEDNVDAADTLCKALELGGHVVDVAYNGTEGLAKAKECRPEIVLCDIGLPGIDGFDVARAFRADAVLKGTFLVALSGYAQLEDMQRTADAGFDRHLAKPLAIEALQEVLAGVSITGTSNSEDEG